jgi:LysR family glycine cleavage system transcriptional activator
MSSLPLSALRAFDKVAEHLSFTRAAQALHVTQSAVSQQVAQLEQRVGRSLVDRSGRRLRLTPHGEQLAAACQRSFGTLEVAIRRVSRQDREALQVRLPPTFAMKWLMPRLTHFQLQYPELELRISTSVDPVDFDHEDVDIALQRASQPDPALHAVAVLEERGILVGAPSLWGHRRPRLSDLKGKTLLFSANRSEDWASWCVGVGQPDLQPAGKIQFGFSLLMYQAALEGLGVCIAQPEFVEDDLAAGRLVAPFNNIVNTGKRYYLVCPARIQYEPAISQFLAWVSKGREQLGEKTRRPGPVLNPS